jgi:hypothetical protein
VLSRTAAGLLLALLVAACVYNVREPRVESVHMPVAPGARRGIAHEEDLHLGPLLLRHRVRQAKSVVAAFGAVRRVVQDEQELHELCAFSGSGTGGLVSGMRAATWTLEASAMRPMTRMAGRSPKASARNPASSAPKAYPESRQSR